MNWLVTSCHQAPSATPTRNWPPTASHAARSMSYRKPSPGAQAPLARSPRRSTSTLADPPVTRIASQTATLMAMSTIDVSAGLPERDAAVRRLDAARRPAPSAMHEGHWKPTAASRMQSGQIGRSHRWQRIQVSRPACR